MSDQFDFIADPSAGHPVDHIEPFASLNPTSAEDRKAVNHYTNLQPMFAKANLTKSDEWSGQHDFAHELL